MIRVPEKRKDSCEGGGKKSLWGNENPRETGTSMRGGTGSSVGRRSTKTGRKRLRSQERGTGVPDSGALGVSEDQLVLLRSRVPNLDVLEPVLGGVGLVRGGGRR